jgi:hypothetical protein
MLPIGKSLSPAMALPKPLTQIAGQRGRDKRFFMLMPAVFSFLFASLLVIYRRCSEETPMRTTFYIEDQLSAIAKRWAIGIL